jgi:hypothetical protein
MKRKLMFLLFLFLAGIFSSVEASSLTDIEVFDIKTQKVIKSVPNTDKIQEEVQHCLTTVNGLSRLLNPIPKEGQIFKIPVQPSRVVNNQWINTLVDEVKVIVPRNGKPLLMVFDDENNPYFFELDYDITPLLSQIRK